MTTQHTPSTSTKFDATVEAVMHPGIVTCVPGDRIARLAQICVSHGVHAVMVGSSHGATPLVVTDLDLVRAALECPEATANQIAREPAGTIEADASIEQAIVTMAELYIAHLLVTDPNSGAPTGVVSSFDVAALIGGYQPRLARIVVPGPARPSPSARTLREAIVHDVMHAGIISCPADAELGAVARCMAEHRVHCIAITGIERPGQHLTWGLISDKDLILAAHRGALDEPAARIAATEPIAVEEGDSLEHVAVLMSEHDTSHIVVVGRSGLPTGMVSTRDVARILAASA
jgi:CBS domain-containing protein